MRNRRKPPTLVSMWMLDVFCCALGCVIMLWTLESLHSSEAASQAKAAARQYIDTRAELIAAREKLAAAESQLAFTVRELEALRARSTQELNVSNQKLTAAMTELDQTRTKLAAVNLQWEETRSKLAASDLELKKLEQQAAGLTAELQRKQKTLDSVNAQLNTTSSSEAALSKLLREKTQEIEALTSLKKSADDRIHDLDAKYRAAARDAKESAESLTLAKGTIRELERKIDDARINIIDLQGVKKGLETKITQMKSEADNRFAGIAMTGRNVVFIVDISGSMKLRDEQTPDPAKWPIVVETVVKVMRSIPDLSKFQVIVFSSSAKILVGNTDWHDFAGEESIRKVMDALKNTNPDGDTNLYSAFELAFRYRPMGMDTIYLFSDGLPTSGPGLTPQQERTYTNRERVEAYSNHLRAELKSVWNSTRNNTRVRINSIGFYYESPEVGAFLWALSRENDGSFVGMSKP